MSESTNSEVFVPTKAAKLGKLAHSLIIVMGRSGSGKSRAGYQLLRDPEYGPKEVHFAMSENALTTYDHAEAHAVPCHSIRDFYDLGVEYARAAKAGKRLPKVIMLDSVNGAIDKEQERYDRDQTGALSGESLQTEKGARNKLAEFGDMGNSLIRTIILYREHVPTDVIVNVTTWEPPDGRPELALEGKIIPKHLTRESNVALHLRAVRDKFDLEKYPQGPPQLPHIFYGHTDSGAFDGNYIARYYQTQDDGEVMCKGHHNLLLREKAYMPDILRKIRGQKPLY